MKRIFLGDKFNTTTPVLPDVEIVEVMAVWDGPLFGICKVHGKNLFFMDLIESVWRFYSENDYDRLWRIYGVYDLPVPECRKIIGEYEHKPRSEWQNEITECSECIGVFWDYK